MAFVAGTKLGTYEILGPLGKGGMGEVYRARDSRLKREVAIKVLPDEFCLDADRVSRFQREAEVLASLNHPHIAAIHHLEEFERSRLLVLELVEGETLADRIARGAVPVRETVEIAKQIAEALEAAHEKGIVHRDLKPANIKITPDGKVKVLDFGLAKMYETETSTENLSQSPTLMSARTGGGVILGTVSYMSPEQARARPVKKQTDIWAFGCVLFEMLTGCMAFSGETVSDTIAKILKDEPDWAALNAVAPAAVARVIGRCLRKDLRLRAHDAGDVRVELEEALVAPSLQATTERRSRRYTAPLAALLLTSILIGGFAWVRFRTDTPEPVWTGTRLGGPQIAYGPRASPDGKMLAFQALVDGQSQVAVMNPKSGNWTLLTHDKNAGFVNHLSWSKDGTKIYFSRYDALPLGVFSVPALGGEPRLLLEDAGGPEVLPDDSLIVSRVNPDRAQQAYRFRPDTGELQPLDALLPLVGLNFYRAFPDAQQIVFFGTPASNRAAPRLHILDLKSGVPRPFGRDLKFDSNYYFGLAVNPLDSSVLVDTGSGDLRQILAVPSDGKSPARVLLTLTGRSWFMDMTTDGFLYVDQVERPTETLRFGESARLPEVMSSVPVGISPVLELADNRFLLNALFDGRSRLLVAKPSGELVPFVDTEEEAGPATFIGSGQVAFTLGKPPHQSIAIASVKDGRVLERLKITATDTVGSLSASGDGTALFYSTGGSIWSHPVKGGEPRKLGPGDAVAFDPAHQSLIVQLNERDGVRLARMSTSGGPAVPIPIHSDLRIPGNSVLGSNAVRIDGQIAVSVSSRDSWFYGAAVLDPATGNLRRVPLRYDGDIVSLSWNPKNEMVTGGQLMRSSLWRFRPESRN